MSLIFPSFDVKSIIFSRFWPGAFSPKIAGKSPGMCGYECELDTVFGGTRSFLDRESTSLVTQACLIPLHCMQCYHCMQCNGMGQA